MAGLNETPERLDPYKNFKFRVKWDGRYVAGVSKVSGLTRAADVVTHREGGDPSSSRAATGRTRYDPIILERGVTYDAAFEHWAGSVAGFGEAWAKRTRSRAFARRSSSRSMTKRASSRLNTRSIGAGCRSARRSSIPTVTATPSRSSTSSSKTKAGSATRLLPSDSSGSMGVALYRTASLDSHG